MSDNGDRNHQGPRCPGAYVLPYHRSSAILRVKSSVRARQGGQPSEQWPESVNWLIAFAVLFVAIFGHLPALHSWWCLDDWGQLARAAGYVPGSGDIPARWLSQHAWWSLAWPLLGLSATAHAWARIVLHSLAAVAVSRIAKRASLPPIAQMLAGIIFAASPIAFTPLYWASGIQELLGGVLALWAVERWLTTRRRGVLIAGVLGAGAILSKESALALPVLFGGLVFANRNGLRGNQRVRWAVVAGLLLVSTFEASLVARHFATGPRDPYATGGYLVMLGNLGKFGWWLPTPIHYFTAQMTWPKASVGLIFLAAWGVGGIRSCRHDRRLPFVTWCCALASLAPVLPLVNQARPYMGYVAAACAALAVASCVPTIRRPRMALVLVTVMTATIWSQATMRGRIGRLDGGGISADPVVRAMQVSRETAQQLTDAITTAGVNHKPLVIYQALMSSPVDASGSVQVGAAASKTQRYAALGGSMGASLVYGNGSVVDWTNSLLSAPENALVICEKVNGFQVWGGTYEALRYAAALCIVANRYEDAIANLARAVELSSGRPLKYPVENRIGLPVNALAAVREKFDHHLISMAIEKKISGDAFLAYSGFLEP